MAKSQIDKMQAQCGGNTAKLPEQLLKMPENQQWMQQQEQSDKNSNDGHLHTLWVKLRKSKNILRQEIKQEQSIQNKKRWRKQSLVC
jgi:hypothetical protein